MLGSLSAEGLTKVYRSYKRREGVSGALANLFKREYSEVRAVDHVSFAIRPGEVVGYVGPNGAGKSTTIKMATGILRPSGGAIRVNGLDPFADRRANALQIGVVFGQRTQLWWDIAVIEAFHLLQKIYEVEPQAYRRRLDRFTQVLGLGDLLHRPVRKLSLGERMRCDLAASLLHAPPVLFLDEPTIGLDVSVKAAVREFIRTLNRESGVTVILTTHDFRDIEELCSRILLIDGGKLLFDGPLAEIRSRFGPTRKIELTFEGKPPLEKLRELGNRHVRVEPLEESSVAITFDRREVSASELMARLLSGFPVKDLALHEPDLAEIMRRIYEEKPLHAREAGPGR